MIKQFI